MIKYLNNNELRISNTKFKAKSVEFKIAALSMKITYHSGYMGFLNENS